MGVYEIIGRIVVYLVLLAVVFLVITITHLWLKNKVKARWYLFIVDWCWSVPVVVIYKIPRYTLDELERAERALKTVKRKTKSSNFVLSRVIKRIEKIEKDNGFN